LLSCGNDRRFPNGGIIPDPRAARGGGGRFAADPRVGPAGFVTHYPGGWEAERTG